MQGLRNSSKELSQPDLREGRNMNIDGAAATQDWSAITRQEKKPVVVFATFGFILTSWGN